MVGRIGYLGQHIEIVEEIVGRAMANLQQEVPEVLRRLRERERRQASLKSQADNYLSLALALPEVQRRAFLEPKLAALHEQVEHVESEVDLLDRSLEELKGNTVSAIDLQKALQTVDALFDELKPHEQKELLSSIVEGGADQPGVDDTDPVRQGHGRAGSAQQRKPTEPVQVRSAFN